MARAIWVKDRSSETVKAVLRAVFARLGVPNTLVSDNAAEFGDEELLDWLNKIGCLAVKTPPMHPQSNGLAERMVQTFKKAVIMWEKGKETFNTFMARFLLNYRSIPHFGRSQSPSQLMGRQIRSPITFKLPMQAPVWYVPTAHTPKEEAIYAGQKGSNTAFVVRKNGCMSLAHEDQIRVRETEEHAPHQMEIDESAGLVKETMILESPRHTMNNSDDPGSQQEEKAIPVRRSQRSNFGVPPIRWGDVES